jgi:hypothetical protein
LAGIERCAESEDKNLYRDIGCTNLLHADLRSVCQVQLYPSRLLVRKLLAKSFLFLQRTG